MRRVLSIPLLLVLCILLTAPALATEIGSSQLLLKATDDDGYTCGAVSLGNYAADSLRQAAGTDFAFLPSGLLGLNLQAGTVDDEALALSFPQDDTIYVVSLTSSQLKELLELSCSRLTLDDTEHLNRPASQWDGFLQMSGLHVIYNVPSMVGSRLWSVKLDDATELDLTDDLAVYTAAVPSSMLDGTYGYPPLSPQREVGSLRQLIASRISSEGISEEPSGKRIILYGARENEIISYFSPFFIFFVVLLIAFFGGHKWRRSANFER